ncbi:GNAT family N-acetyltransferase [Achromobacter insolitus]|uniref:GNAT family N-acetyltransferase n=1 Tax=Achromobacter insolitus TaxID=217204 RepID=UPI000538AFE2|nr:GNAT family protein [Achromobacter insolitus]APX74519.1 GNAT family N-acetyltransferase [Achromobacter insolitus]AVG39413.1 N-acetyltransferase [Achromobacter insolitus]OAE50206.1 GNAT family acetyltransferase [Achromobacter insolitus]OCZ51141.1 GNAT family acetyltransferase [Achromobacter insolitus]OWT60854.1 N-acetyltransferase [Achromobacter insolitus]
MTVPRLQPVTLAGEVVRLEPLAAGHAAPLAQVGLHPELWKLQPEPVQTLDDMQRYVDRALAAQREGHCLPFVIVRQEDDQIIGATRYMDVALAHKRLEIGGTWLTPSSQRSGANTEAKFLLLQHAFETIGIIRVVFKTELSNMQSRQAILRIGGVEEGVFRKHLIAQSGRARDMIYFAILDEDWPTVKARLLTRLRRVA